jgi:hypothetical protein
LFKKRACHKIANGDEEKKVLHFGGERHKTFSLSLRLRLSLITVFARRNTRRVSSFGACSGGGTTARVVSFLSLLSELFVVSLPSKKQKQEHNNNSHFFVQHHHRRRL